MKKIKIGLSICLLATACVTHAKTVSFGADVWMPVNGEPGDKNHPGFQVEIANHVFNKAGYSVNYKNYPWSRALELTRGGELNCVFGAARGDEPNFEFPNRPMGLASAHFFTKADHPLEIKGAESLTKYKLGAITDYSYDPNVDAYIAAHKADRNLVELVSANNALEQNIQKVLYGRLDALVEVKMVFEYKIKEIGSSMDKFADKGGLSKPEPIYIACNKNSSKFIDMLNESLPELEKDGTFEKILSKYGVAKWW